MLNNINIIGRLVAEPELRRTQSDIAVTSFRIACDRDRKNASGEREADFIDCVAWRSVADTVAKYFTKGRMIAVNGRLQVRKWTDRDGNNRTSTEILANNVYFVDSKRAADKHAEEELASANSDSAAYKALSIPELYAPKLTFVSSHNLHEIVADKLLRRKLSKFLRDNFKWSSSEIKLFDDFVPYAGTGRAAAFRCLGFDLR